MSEMPREMAERLHDEGYISQKDENGQGIQMVTLVFSDGEVVYTKGHDLFMSRTLHMIRPGFIPESQDPCFFPRQIGESSYAIVKDSGIANDLRQGLWKWWLQVQDDERKREEHFFDYKKK